MVIQVIISVVILVVIAIFIVKVIMKTPISKIVSLKMMSFFIGSVIAVSLIAIIVGSFLSPKQSITEQVQSEESVAKELQAGNEMKYADYFVDEEELTVEGDTLWINKEELDQRPAYYVQRGESTGQIVKIRNYILPAVKHGYEMNQSNIKNDIDFTEQKNLQITVPENVVIKEEFKIFDSKLTTNYFESLEEFDYFVQQLTIIEIPKNMKIFYETDLPLGGI